MYNFYLFNQLVTSAGNRSLMQNVMQEMAQFSGVKHFKNSGWETKTEVCIQKFYFGEMVSSFSKNPPMCVKVSGTN